MMIKTATSALMGLGLTAIAFGGAYAQDGAMKPTGGGMMMSGGMSRKMSDDDTKTIKMCKAMDHGAMMKNQKCADMMKTHPDAMKMDSGGMMKK